MPFLYEQLDTLRDFGSYAEIPSYIQENVNPSFTLRPYQVRAFENFVTYFENEKREASSTPFLQGTLSDQVFQQVFH